MGFGISVNFCWTLILKVVTHVVLRVIIVLIALWFYFVIGNWFASDRVV